MYIEFMGARAYVCVRASPDCRDAAAGRRQTHQMEAMTKSLIIAEKPSVAQDIVRALTPNVGKFDKHDEYFENDKYIVTSAVGHLLEIKAPEEYDVKRGKWSFAHLPVIPPHFDLNPIDKSKGRLNAIVKLAKRKDVAELINACDAGREGELIFRLIQQHAKSKHPVRRLWLQSMTPAAIREGFDNLRRDEDMQGLAEAARSRSEADWLVGMNATRAVTLWRRSEQDVLCSLGRVQTPTLALLVRRERQIERHVPRDYFEVHADLQTKDEARRFRAQWRFRKVKRLAALPLAEEIRERSTAAAARGEGPVVESVEGKTQREPPPLLFDLTALQRTANRRFGLSAHRTLQVAQALYERHKLITYPRTDSRHLTSDVARELEITERTVQRIVMELEAAGFITRQRHGRRNSYVVHPHHSPRHSLVSHQSVTAMQHFFLHQERLDGPGAASAAHDAGSPGPA